MKIWKRSFFAVLLLGMLISFNTQASYGDIDKTTTLFAWPVSTADMTVYADSTMKTAQDQVPYSEYEIYGISGNTAMVTYKLAGVSKKGYVELSRFFCDVNFKKTGAFISNGAGLYLYKKPKAAKDNRYTVAAYRSGGLVVGVSGNYVQLMMKKGTHFYLGWVKKSNSTKYVLKSMTHTDQILSNGTYLLANKSRSGYAVTWKDGTWQLSKSISSSTQKFALVYTDGSYHLKNMSSSANLTINKVSDFQVIRTGAYFYIQSLDGSMGLAWVNDKLTLVKPANSTVQKWKITKVYKKPAVSEATVYSQYDPVFGSAVYQKGYDGTRTISSSGCGLISLVNAIYALNGEYIPPTKLVSFAVSRGHYFYNQGTADTLYKDVSNKWGKTYHFRHVGKTTSLNTVKKVLKSKGTAIALVPGHYIAIVAYRKSDNKYLVYDSSITGRRPTTIYGDWVSASTFSSGSMACEYFHMFKTR